MAKIGRGLLTIAAGQAAMLSRISQPWQLQRKVGAMTATRAKQFRTWMIGLYTSRRLALGKEV
jgi:hypothetical protein